MRMLLDPQDQSLVRSGDAKREELLVWAWTSTTECATCGPPKAAAANLRTLESDPPPRQDIGGRTPTTPRLRDARLRFLPTR